MRQERRKITPLIGVWLAIILLAASLAACSSSDGGSGKSSYEEANTTEASPPVMSTEAKSESASADTAASTGSQPGSGIADTSARDNFHRQVIYTADLHMQVKDFASARSAIDQLIVNSGGYLLSFVEDESSDRLSGSFKIKVPAKGFDTFIDAIDKLPDKKLSKSINGEDVTEEYADLAARLKAKEVAEKRLFSFMESAKNSTDLVAFSKELANVQEEIERIKGRMRYIDQNVDYSTINIDMYQTLSGEGTEPELNEKQSLMTKAGNALRRSADMIVELGKALVIIAAFLLPLLPIIGLVVLVVFIVNRRRKRAESKASDNSQQNDQNDHTPPGDDPLA